MHAHTHTYSTVASSGVSATDLLCVVSCVALPRDSMYLFYEVVINSRLNDGSHFMSLTLTHMCMHAHGHTAIGNSSSHRPDILSTCPNSIRHFGLGNSRQLFSLPHLLPQPSFPPPRPYKEGCRRRTSDVRHQRGGAENRVRKRRARMHSRKG